MKDLFWETGRVPSAVPRLAHAPIYLPPVDLLAVDGRFYDIDEVCIYNSYAWNGNLNTPRWVVTMEAQERKNGENFVFKINILWSVVEREGLIAYAHDRGRALATMARESVENYLRFHRFPARCCNPMYPIVLEVP